MSSECGISASLSSECQLSLSRIQFNLSHTRGLVAVAVNSDAAVRPPSLTALHAYCDAHRTVRMKGLDAVAVNAENAVHHLSLTPFHAYCVTNGTVCTKGLVAVTDNSD